MRRAFLALAAGSPVRRVAVLLASAARAAEAIATLTRPTDPRLADAWQLVAHARRRCLLGPYAVRSERGQS